ncbi:MAG: sigma-70 family RNA polymerase sigma factor [Planctomycetota bacterium]
MHDVDTLIEQHLEYVRKLAREIHRKLPERAIFDDLVGYGELGLVEAANKFDPHAGAAFTTFAYYRIRGSIFDGIRKMSWLPPRVRKQVTEDAGADQVAQSAAESGIDPNAEPEALADKFHEVVERLGAVFMVSDLSSDDEDDDSLDPSDTSDPAEPMVNREIHAKVGQALAALPEDHRDLIDLFYFKQKSMTEIAQDLGVHKATVSRLHGKAIAALQQALAAET